MFTDRKANSLQTRRVRQPWPADRPYRILSLDGGGIKGAFTAELLRLCEEAFSNEQPLRRYFDCIAGTSTGGIIALGLSIDMPMSDVVGFYRDDGRKIFPPLPTDRWGGTKRFFRSLNKPRLKHEALEEALKARFGHRLLGEARTRLVIPAFMMPKTEITVFKTDHHGDFKNDYRTPMWKVARSTSAAPTYLKGLEDEASGKIFMDGGVWANNPVMVALVDAMSAYDLSFSQIEILSIGTGNPPFHLKIDDVHGGLIAWKQVIEAAMFLTSDNATSQAKLLLGPDRCVRIEPTGNDAAVSMDDYDAAYAALPDCAARLFDQNREFLASFFGQVVSERERHYTL